MELTPEERRRIHETEKARLEAKAEIESEDRRRVFSTVTRGGVIMVGIVITLWAVGSLVRSNRPDSGGFVAVHDDLSLFLSKYGPPDKEVSTERDDPRPPIVTRWLDYNAERVRAVYYPDVPVGTPPPYSTWKLMGFMDPTTNTALSPDEVVHRLEGRKRL